MMCLISFIVLIINICLLIKFINLLLMIINKKKNTFKQSLKGFPVVTLKNPHQLFFEYSSFFAHVGSWGTGPGGLFGGHL